MNRKLFDKKLRQQERIFVREKVNEIDSLTTNNPTQFWEHINKLGPRKKESIPMEVVSHNAQSTSNINEVLEKWKQDFSQIYNRPEGENFDMEFYNNTMLDRMRLEGSMTDPLYIENELLNSPITIDEVIKVVRKLKKNKSVGIDRIPNEILQCKEVTRILTHLFQSCFDSGILPSVWKQAIISPIPKDAKADSRVPFNYRGISLLSTLSKTYTSLLNNRIEQFCDDKNLLVDEQNGFRKKRTCIDHIYSLSTVIENRNKQKKDTYAAFIDLKKAFDTVSRELLEYKLLKNGIDGKIFRSIKSLNSDTLAKVKVNSYYTDWFRTSSGVRQGDCLSPLLFSLYINDLAIELKNLKKGVPINENEDVTILMYADDIVILAENETDLQTQLDRITNWCKQWQLMINNDKSKVMHFRRKNKDITDREFFLQDNKIECVDKYKYLGIIFDQHLTFDDACKALGAAAGRALGGVNQKFKLMKNMGLKTYTKLFESCVQSVLLYCSGVWAMKHGKSLQKVQNRAMRFFLGVHKFTPTLGMSGDMGWCDVDTEIKCNIIRQWNRIIKMSDDRITKKIFIMDTIEQRSNWSICVNNILDELNMSDKYENRETCNIDYIVTKLNNVYKQSWLDKIVNQTKLRTYHTYKKEHKGEVYAETCLDRGDRSYIAQFRLGILPIRIETGRFKREKIEDRLCPFCVNSVEDELHFVFYCQKYIGERETLFANLLSKANVQQVGNDSKILEKIFENSVATRLLAKYLKSAMFLRNKDLYV